MKRTANAQWKGSGKEGSGRMTTQSGILNSDQYGYKTRFENEPGTNPEELVAAAHSGCYSMKLAFVLGAAGFTPDTIDVACTITFENGAITESHLDVTGHVPNIEEGKFKTCAEEARVTCPISKSLNPNITITVDAKLA